jgi:hypothetical protein
MVIDSSKVDEAVLTELLDILYGSDSVDARLPMPEEVLELVGGSGTEVRLTGANAPTYNQGTHVVTLPAVTGVAWEVNGEDAASGAQPALAVGESANVRANAMVGYVAGDDDWTFDYGVLKSKGQRMLTITVQVLAARGMTPSFATEGDVVLELEHLWSRCQNGSQNSKSPFSRTRSLRRGPRVREVHVSDPNTLRRFSANSLTRTSRRSTTTSTPR